MRVGPFELFILLVVVFLISLAIIFVKMVLLGGKQKQLVYFQSTPINEPLQNSGNVIHSVTYNIHDSSIAGDLKSGLNQQDD